MLPDPPYRPARFLMDEGFKEYPGYTTGQPWNGFATPAFTRQIADLVAIALHGRYDAETDSYVFTGDDEDWRFDGFDAETTDGVHHLYAIGAFAWCWHEAEEARDPIGETLSRALDTLRWIKMELALHQATSAMPLEFLARLDAEIEQLETALPDPPRVGPPVTPRESEVLGFIVRHIGAHGFQPSLREIGDHVGIRSTKRVKDVCTSLARNGFLVQRTRGGARSMHVVGLRVDVLQTLIPEE